MVARLFQKDECRSVLPAMGTEEMSDETIKGISVQNMDQEFLEPQRLRAFSGLTPICGGSGVTFAIGTVVLLKSGGPAMTVIETADDKAHCAWHKDDGEVVTIWLPVIALKVKP